MLDRSVREVWHFMTIIHPLTLLILWGMTAGMGWGVQTLVEAMLGVTAGKVAGFATVIAFWVFLGRNQAVGEAEAAAKATTAAAPAPPPADADEVIEAEWEHVKPPALRKAGGR